VTSLSAHDQRQADRATRGCGLVLETLATAGGRGAWTLDGLASHIRFYGPQEFTAINSNDTQVWCAMLRVKGEITAVSRTGPVRYALAAQGGHQ
jgi:hypothetical protein